VPEMPKPLTTDQDLNQRVNDIETFRSGHQVTVASAHGDGTIRLWKEVNGLLVLDDTKARHKKAITSISFTPNGTLISASEDCTIKKTVI